MKEIPKFEDYRHGDAGRDGGGIYRHIARDTRIPNILTKGDYSTLSWRAICTTLYSKPGEEKLKVCIMDFYFTRLCCKLNLMVGVLLFFFGADKFSGHGYFGSRRNCSVPLY